MAKRGPRMSAQIPEELLDSIRFAGACMADIRALAGQLAGLATAEIESLLQKFVENGEDQALSRLLQVCAFNGVKLDPKVLCACLGVCEDILDSAPASHCRTKAQSNRCWRQPPQRRCRSNGSALPPDWQPS